MREEGQKVPVSQDGREIINGFDVSLIRPPMSLQQVQWRSSERNMAQVKRALLAFHTLEVMAANIYRFQIGRRPTELNRQLTAAMCNEMTHIQDFEVKLREYGLSPSKFRWAYWLVACVLGTWSKMRGEKAILRTGIWVESKAVRHYEELLKSVPWDDESRKVIEKDQADEYGHIHRWRTMLAKVS